MPPRRSARLAMKPRVNFREPSLRISKYPRVTKQRTPYPSTCSKILIGLNYIILIAFSLTLTAPFVVTDNHVRKYLTVT